MDDRKTVKTSVAVKQVLEDLKRRKSLKNESEVIAYLLMVYDWAEPKISIRDDYTIRESSKNLNRQLTIDVKSKLKNFQSSGRV